MSHVFDSMHQEYWIPPYVDAPQETRVTRHSSYAGTMNSYAREVHIDQHGQVGPNRRFASSDFTWRLVR